MNLVNEIVIYLKHLPFYRLKYGFFGFQRARIRRIWRQAMYPIKSVHAWLTVQSCFFHVFCFFFIIIHFKKKTYILSISSLINTHRFWN